jgi:hypothetical protein
VTTVRVVTGAAVAAASWGLFEAQWVRLGELVVPTGRLPPGLSGLRVAHLSDLHVGAPGLNGRALRRGVDLVRRAAPDLVCVTGDLRARRAGDAVLRRELARLEAPLGAYAVLGNHDHAHGHDPFADGQALEHLDGTPVRLLRDECVDVDVGGVHLAVAGLDPRSHPDRPPADARPLPTMAGDYRILLAHFPRTFDRLSPRAADLVLSGHLHGGQLCVPYPGGKLRLSHGPGRYAEGLYGREGAVLHVSRGLGTTFVPFRVAARPEVTIIELQTL